MKVLQQQKNVLNPRGYNNNYNNCKLSGSLENFRNSNHNGEYAQYWSQGLVNYLNTVQIGEKIPIRLYDNLEGKWKVINITFRGFVNEMTKELTRQKTQQYNWVALPGRNTNWRMLIRYDPVLRL
jgi:hypothetical protein